MNPTLFPLILALCFGAIIGLERRLNGHVAGIHTNSLVSLGSAVFTVVGTTMSHGDIESARVIAQIVTGIGFLCGGVIMRDGMRIRGLNTAATIWCSAAVGCLTAIHQIQLAFSVALLVAVSNFLLHAIEHRLPWFSSPLKDDA